MARSKKIPSEVDVKALALEQEEQTMRRAASSPGCMAVTYVAKGDKLALLVCKRYEKPRRRLYVCKIVSVEDEK